MAEIVIQTRVTHPRNPVNIIRRERLLNLIRRNVDKSLILVCGPAGIGKTTLIGDFLSDNITSAWFSVSGDINNTYAFFRYLTYSLKNINKQFGDLTLQIIETVKQEEKRFQGLDNVIKEISGNFINDFCQNFSSDVYLVIDDLHNIKNSEWLRLCFNKLFDNIPQNLHIIITTRAIPEFNLTKLSASRTIFQIQPYDLNFTKEEIIKLLDNIYSLKYSEDDLRFLEDKLGGWITGIHLIIQAYGENLSDAKLQVESVPENIFDFFANEIFEQLEDKTREFLLNTAMMEIIDPAVCDSILGITNSNIIINGLLNKNIFIQPIDDPDRTSKPLPAPKYYFYQEFFKNFLISKLNRVRTKEEINSLLKKFYYYYLEVNDAQSAINYCLLAGEHRLAIPLITKNFQKYFDEGKFENLWKWIESLPAGSEAETPELFLYKSKLFKFYQGDLEKALKYTEKAIAYLKKQNENEFIISCYIAKADVLLDFGKNNEVIQDLIRLAEVNTTPENKAKILYNLGYSYFMNSDYEKSLELLNKSLEICTENDFKDIQLDIFNVMGFIYINRGEYIKGTFYYEKILERSNNLFKKFVSLCNLVLVCSRSGKYERAREYISTAQKLLHRFTTPIFENAFLLANLSLRYDVGDYEESIELLEKINRTAKKLERKDHIHLSYELLAEAYYYLKKPVKACEYLNLSRKYLDGENKFDMVHYSCSEALLRKREGQFEGVENILTDAYSFYDKNMFLENKVKVGFHLADFYNISNMAESALKILKDVLRTGVEKEYISFFERQLIESRTLFDLAIENKIEKGFIKTITESLIDRKNFEWLSSQCRERIAQRIEELYDIKMQCFGGLEFKVRGKRIQEKIWIRKKRKLILAYLLLFPMVPLTKDKIIDIFYPETPFDSADNIFHQTISNIRSAVKIENIKKSEKSKEKPKIDKIKNEEKGVFSPQLILYEDKILKLNSDYIYKSDALEFNQLYNLSRAAGIGTEEKIELSKRAIELYKGELLAGYYDQWCEDLRQEYQNKAISLSEDLIDALKSIKNYKEVFFYSEKLLTIDKLSENAYLNIIESCVKQESINRARDKFSQMLKTFDAELGEKPSKDCMEKIRKMLS